ncbi:MAG: Cytochrome c-type biogenesis protein CcmF [Gammaproteobacteria bacterium]|nr:Cytochrome c-type biogenesis protein CcmF [Gammaproteobacteria bacterium]
MIPEIGHFALMLALGLAVVQAVVPIVGAAKGYPQWIAVARPAARAQLLMVALAYGCLTYAFIAHDFSVGYVAENSNLELPLGYRISGVWGAHEGSLLLWAFVLALWTGAVSVFSRHIPEAMVARVLGVMGFISVGFLLFILLTSNPFERLLPALVEGGDLNPLLQDIGLVIHPPMLYMGYVGFSVAFAFAVAALLSGRLDTAWARWSRPWTTVAWLFLTIGIALGSWWAYYELGWGGWWFWDPVENASFMPWLVGTALIHSLAATENRGVFKAWTVLLAVFAFSLSLLGTFLVRSGVLTSVHAFATDPERGIFILIFLFVVVGGSLALYAWRAPRIRSGVQFSAVSRETGVLLNNVLLMVTTASVLLGTLYPLILDAAGLGKISVGPPYFNTVFIPLTLPLALLVGIGAMARWKRTDPFDLLKSLRWVFVASLGLGVALPFFMHAGFSWIAAGGLTLALWVMLSTVYGVFARIANKQDKLSALRKLPGGFLGMTLAHFGIGVFIVGITLTNIYSIERDISAAPGESYTVAGYRFQFNGVRTIKGPNYSARRGEIVAFRNNREIVSLSPEKRTYGVSQNPMTEAAIDAGLMRDLYVALGDPVDAQGSWTLRIYYKSFIRWIWLGALFMAIGGIFAASDGRYRSTRRTAVAASEYPNQNRRGATA